MEHTTNYQLSQWSMEDRIRMEDFNGDNQKIDAALKAEANARAAETAARKSADAALQTALAKCGNCRMELLTYTGTGTYGSDKPTKISFSTRPALFLAMGDRAFMAAQGGAAAGGRIAYSAGSHTTVVSQIDVVWSGNEAWFYSPSAADLQLNTKGALYWVLALYQMDK